MGIVVIVMNVATLHISPPTSHDECFSTSECFLKNVGKHYTISFSNRAPISFLLCSAAAYISLVNVPSSSVLTFPMIAATASLSVLFRIQFAHQRSILLRMAAVLSFWCSLCSERTKRRKPAFRCSSPRIERHFKMRVIRRLLCDEPIANMSKKLT